MKGKLLTTFLIVIVLIILILIVLEIPRYIKLRDPDLSYLDKMWSKKKMVDSEERVVVSLSTIPDRINLIKPTIASLLDQNKSFDEIAINIPHVSRKGGEYKIPDWLTDLSMSGFHVKIHRVEKDEGPATKLLPTLRREGPNTRIIAVDDDVVYHSKTVNNLVKEFEKTKKAITHYGVKLDKNGNLPTNSSRIKNFFTGRKEVDLLQGFSGFIVTKSMFPEEAFDLSNGPEEAISVDDVWFSGWLRYNKVPIQTSGFTFVKLPIVNFGKMRSTTSLGDGENKEFVRDMKIIKWFQKEKGIRPVVLDH